MSADLFAEFSQPSKPSSQPAQQQQPSSFPAPGNNYTQAKDPFDFGFGGAASSTATPPAATPQWPAYQPQQPAAGAFAPPPAMNSQPAASSAADDDDGWGDFEVAETTAPPAQAPVQPQQPSWQSSAFSVPSQGMPTGPSSGSSAFDMMDNNFTGAPRRQMQEPGEIAWPQQEKKKPSKMRVQRPAEDPDVLFDAGDFELEDGEFDGEEDDEDEDGDDFGDFESVRSPPAAALVQQPKPKPDPTPTYSQPPSMDLLSLDDAPQAPPSHTPPVSAKEQQLASRPAGALSFGASKPTKSTGRPSPFGDSDDLLSLGQTAPKTKPSATTPPPKTQSHQKKTSTSKVTSSAWAVESQDDDWAAWDDGPSNSGKADIDQAPAPSSWDWGAEESSKPVASNDNDPPPVNVPPPSIILSTFPELLGSGNSLFKSTSGQSRSIKEQILSNPKALQFLQGYILLATTAARVIAGRKHRWHRDKILAKSMSISAAGSKGMKLAGVDKTQAVREDREAADVVAVWREHVGRLRSAVAAANSAGKASVSLKVPELSETLPVHTAKNVPTAPKPCVICGLKRDERITKVDFEVEDSFGEWWVEHWGHRACKNFWVEHEQHLRQR